MANQPGDPILILTRSSEYLEQWHKENPFQKWHKKNYRANTLSDQEAFDNTVLEFIEDGHIPACAHRMANNRDCNCGKCEGEELNFD